MNKPTFKSSNGRGGGGGGGKGLLGGRGKGEGVVGIPEKLVGGERGTVRGKSVFPENWRVESGEWRVESGEWNKFTSGHITYM